MTLKAADTIPAPVAPALGWRGAMLRFFGDPIAYMEELQRLGGSVGRFVQGGNRNIIFTRSDVPPAETTLFAFGPGATYDLLSNVDMYWSTRFEGPDTEAFDKQSTSIFSTSGGQHKRQRRLLMPAFHRQYIENYHAIMVAYVRQMLHHWQPGAQIDLADEMHRVTLYIANKALFGLETSDATDSIGSMVGRWLNLVISPGARLRINAPFTPYGQLIRLTERLVETIEAQIQARRDSGLQDLDMLTLMIRTTDEDGDRLTLTELVGNTSTMFIAGHETSANALAWTLLLLAQHPDVYAEVCAELDRVLGGAPPTLEQLRSLPLLQRVINEGLRLIPPASMLGRVAAADGKLGDYAVPRGTEVMYSPYITHRLPELYPEPYQFRPERWESITPGPYEYIPFSAGARRCLGAEFATMEMTVAMAMILQAVRLEAVPGAEINRNLVITLSPKTGIPMQLRRRDGEFGHSAAPLRGNINQMVQFPPLAQG